MKRNINWIIIITSIIYLLLIITTLFYTFTGNLSKVVGQELPQWFGYYIYITSLIYIVGFAFILKMKKLALIILSSITVILYLYNYFIGNHAAYMDALEQAKNLKKEKPPWKADGHF